MAAFFVKKARHVTFIKTPHDTFSTQSSVYAPIRFNFFCDTSLTQKMLELRSISLRISMSPIAKSEGKTPKTVDLMKTSSERQTLETWFPVLDYTLTLNSSRGKRSWKIRLILAPPSSSFVSTWSPEPSMHFSKSTPNCWTILIMTKQNNYSYTQQ